MIQNMFGVKSPMKKRVHAQCVVLTVSAIVCTLISVQDVLGAGVQRGTAVSDSNGTIMVKISRVDTAKSFLIFSTRHNSNRPVGSELRGRIATDTTLEFTRVTNDTTSVPITIQWYVVEFISGIRVQRGEVGQTDSVVNVQISPVASLNQAFVTWSKSVSAQDQSWDFNDPIVGELTKPDTLQFRTGPGSTVMHVISWQVIEFTNAASVNVQKGSIKTMGTNSLSVTATLNPAVNVNGTFVLVGYRMNVSGTNLGPRMLRAQLTNSTTITIDRSVAASTDTINEIVWQAVELKDGSAVQQGNQNFPAGVAQQTVALSAADTTRAIAFASVQASAGQSLGRTPFTADDSVGIASATFALAPTSLTLTRNNTSAVADFGWFVVQFSATSVPIQLASFSAQPGPVSSMVILRWSTLTETNNYGFEVQRKRTGVADFTALPNSLIPGHGTTLQPQHYTFTDVGVTPGHWLYRLKQIDLDGSAHYTDDVSVDVLTDVKEESLPTTFALEQNYPNPFNPTTTIKYDVAGVRGQPSVVSLKIFDVLGREVSVLVNERKEPGSYTVTFDASALTSGVYFYRLQASRIGGGQIYNFVDTKRLLLIR
jgi:hypothetical protein